MGMGFFRKAFQGLLSYFEVRRELEGGLYLDEDSLKALKRIAVEFEGLEDFCQRISSCDKCDLSRNRRKFVFGKGSPEAKLVFVGEAPGEEEDLQGIPFVGRAGRLLDELLKLVGFSYDDIYICNVVKCHPPGNRDPFPEEAEKCEPYLHRQIEIIGPRMIVALGRVAAQNLLKSNASLGKLKKNVHNYKGIPLFVTYHPAFILRNGNYRGELEADLRRFKEYMDKG